MCAVKRRQSCAIQIYDGHCDHSGNLLLAVIMARSPKPYHCELMATENPGYLSSETIDPSSHKLCNDMQLGRFPITSLRNIEVMAG